MGSDREPQAPEAGEVPEVAIAGHQAHAVVEAGLGDQGVRESRSTAAPDQLRPQQARSLPVARRGADLPAADPASRASLDPQPLHLLVEAHIPLESGQAADPKGGPLQPDALIAKE